MSDSLWGDIDGDAEIRTPADVLREQADHLTSATKRRLVGDLAGPVAQRGRIVTELVIRVPALDDYTVTVLRLTYSAQLYPVKVSAVLESASGSDANDEGELKAAIREILASPSVQTTVKGLLGHAPRPRPDEDEEDPF